MPFVNGKQQQKSNTVHCFHFANDKAALTQATNDDLTTSCTRGRQAGRQAAEGRLSDRRGLTNWREGKRNEKAAFSSLCSGAPAGGD